MAPSSIDKAVADRALVKSVLEQCELHVNDHVKTPLTEAQVSRLMTRVEGAEQELTEIHRRIHQLAVDMTTHEASYRELSSKAFQLHGILHGIKISFPMSSSSTIPSSSTSTSRMDMKLPKLEVPTFSGDIIEWVTFKDMFNTAVHSTSLSDAQKLAYLKTLLTGEALRQINSLAITDGNYQIAVDLLENRYQNFREILFAILRRFSAQPTLNTQSAVSIRSTIDVSRECMRSMEILHLPRTDTSDAIFLFFICSKLDPSSKELWEQTLNNSSIPPLDSLFSFLEQRARGLAASSSTIDNKQKTSQYCKESGKKSTVRVLHTKPSSGCKLCSSNHTMSKCPIFIAQPIQERIETVKRLNLCHNCLFNGHSYKNCSSSWRCKTCKKPHHTLIHRQNDSTTTPSNEELTGTSTSLTYHTKDDLLINRTLLATALVKVSDSQGNHLHCRALLDSGSTTTFITESCAQKLGLQRRKTSTEIIGLSSSSVTKSKGITDIIIKPHFESHESFSSQALIITKITGLLPSFRVEPSLWTHLKGIQLADPNFHMPGHIDLLLGADIFWSVLQQGKRSSHSSMPVAFCSSFGWLVGGQASSLSSNKVRVHHADINLDQLLPKFWDLEENYSNQAILTKEEILCDEHFISTHTRDQSGRFTVSIPWKSPRLPLGSSRDSALRQFKQLERRLANQPEYREQYNKFMQEYESMGHMQMISREEEENLTTDKHFIPHHFVLKADSTTTQFRVVFNASFKTTSGYSLNDCMMVGPVIQDSLADIIMRMRVHEIAFTADIAKMYRQIRLNSDDCEFQYIYWRDCPSKPIRIYKLLTITYGTAAAPYLATRALQQVAMEHRDSCPVASEIINRDTYVDDLMSGASTLEEALEAKDQLLQVTNAACFPLRKWSSNCPELMKSIPEDLREMKPRINFNFDETVKTLGVTWNTTQDEYEFSIRVPSTDTNSSTKRSILSENARVFDPVGWLSPLVIRGKLLIQELWKLQCGWDSKVTPEIQQQWDEYKSDLQHLPTVSIPRKAVPKGTTHFDIAGFSDASEKAYAAVVYLVASSSSSTTATLITSKTRVAPLKQVSIPRLELCGAVLLSHLVIRVKKALRLPIRHIRCFTDSTIVVAWINKPPTHWKTFVANRVSEIQSNISSECWFHVPGEENPADCASRGITTADLVNHSLWWNGPAWLLTAHLNELHTSSEETHLEARPIQQQTFIAGTTDLLPLLQNVSSLRKLLRVTAWVRRFINNYFHKAETIRGPLSPEEISKSLNCWIRRCQNSSFPEDIKCILTNKCLPSKSRILSLAPFIDSDGILRVGGRLHKSTLPFSQRHPALLPRHSPLTTLIVRDRHLKLCHAGVQLLMSSIQEEFWIINGKDTIRNLVSKCVVCRRHAATIQQQFMGNLPATRVNPSRPFSTSGVDYAGPFVCKTMNNRSRTTHKAYLCIFVCFTTKAVHLEAVSSLSTDAFLASLRRFTSRRGRPTDIHSDCGTNFVGAHADLQQFAGLVKNPVHNNHIADSISSEGISWHFNPAGAPHFGGLWEAGVKSVKHHLKRVIGNQILNFEELTTIFTQIEACLNSRPIIPLSSDPNDLQALTPGHFLIGSSLTAVPEPDLADIKTGRLDRWQLVQSIQQQFWSRWSREYLTRLQQRPKWLKQRSNIQLEDLVLVKDDRLPPLKWKLGRIITLHPGEDKLVRVVTLKTSDGEIKRPIAKLCLLPITDSKSDCV